MLDFDDFKNDDNSIDWTAYRSARVDLGEVCSKCDTYIMFGGKGYRVECGSCIALKRDTQEVQHDNLLRCPACGHSWDPGDCENYAVYSDGDHDVSCHECDHDFLISTSVSYTFTSPERVKDTAEESPTE